MNLIPRFVFATALSLVLAGSSHSFAATDTAAKERKLPFHGKLEKVDTSAQTITLSGKSARVFHLTPETKITDGSGKPSTLSAAVVGEDVGGSYSKGADSLMTLHSVRFGAKDKADETAAAKTSPAPETTMVSPPPASAPAPVATSSPGMTAAAPGPAPTETPSTKKMRFSGKVVSVDAAAKTLVVHGKGDETFTVSSSTKMTGADSLSALTPGEKVSGTYMKSADGTMMLATLKVK